jgi:hypothetical protein
MRGPPRHGIYSRRVSLADDVERAAGLAATYAKPGDRVTGVIPAEPASGSRVYVCSFDGADAYQGWLAVRADGAPVADRTELRAAVSIAALCEVAEDAALGGDLDGLVARLEELRDAEAPEGIEGAIEAAQALRAVIGEPPQLATPARLDEIGAAVRRLESELDPTAPSPFAGALKSAQDAVAQLQREIEAGYLLPLT